jgi:hypothetical protein
MTDVALPEASSSAAPTSALPGSVRASFTSALESRYAFSAGGPR